MSYSLVMKAYEEDPQFARIVDDITDLIHEPASYKWVNEKALKAYNDALNRNDTLETLEQDDPAYQVFVDNQVHFLRNIAIMVLARM